MPLRSRLRGTDHPAQGEDRSLSWYTVALREIRPSDMVRRESVKAGEPKPGKVIVSCLSFSHLLLPEGQAGSWRGHTAPSRGALHCLHASQVSPSVCFLCPKPASQQQLGRGEQGGGTKLTPRACIGGSWARDAELGAACTSPAHLQPFLVGGEAAFAMVSCEKPAPGSSPLRLLEKEIFLCRKLLLENSPAAWEKLLRN